ncbi:MULTISPECIES: hypothetical protein [Bradyrhizobium]|uniref:hypothetical protein n=1 Tax=Bradyrhizobium sp. BWC-3-1 TaxID=3080012 RepID=UPI0013966985|nr:MULTISPECIES: hypothetical protein [Bradyrhizobium]WOH62859.1 hypothetical protein RX329_13275 [Bradyrhizobium sp. BWC-3-1]
MSDLVVIAFPTEAKAEEVRQKLLAMQKEFQIDGAGGLGREFDGRHQRGVWGKLHFPDHAARRDE